MKIKQVVYLTQTSFSKRDKDRFGIDVFLKYGIDVVVMDVTAYMDAQVAKKYILNEQNSYDCVKEFSTYREIEKFILSCNKDSVFISFIGESSFKSLRVLNLLYKYKKEFGIILSGSLPATNRKYGIAEKLKLLSFKNIIRLAGKAFYMFFFNKFKYSFVIASGEESYNIIKNRYKDAMVIDGHAFDYDLYLQKHRDACLFQKEDYAVFLDEFFPFHPNYIRHGVDYSHFAESYYRKLSTFFDHIEKVFNLKVVISAHPRSYYDKLPDYWNGRKFIIGNTVDLVKNSKICILHASTSVNFAVLYTKALFFVTMQEIKNSNLQSMLEAMSKELKSTIIDMDDFDENINLGIDYDESSYELYKSRYIKLKGNPDINNWELLYNNLLTRKDGNDE